MRKSKKINDRIVEEFTIIPIVQHVCQRVGISRSTFYRWCEEDKQFAINCEAAALKGSQSINDLAESQLILLMKKGEYKAIVYWLSHHKDEYKDKSHDSKKEIGWSDVLTYMNKYFPDRRNNDEIHRS